MRHHRLFKVLLTAALLFGLSATASAKLSFGEVIKMLKDRLSTKVIISAVKDSKTTFKLTTKEISRLYGLGADNSIIDALMGKGLAVKAKTVVRKSSDRRDYRSRDRDRRDRDYRSRDRDRRDRDYRSRDRGSRDGGYGTRGRGSRYRDYRSRDRDRRDRDYRSRDRGSRYRDYRSRDRGSRDGGYGTRSRDRRYRDDRGRDRGRRDRDYRSRDRERRDREYRRKEREKEKNDRLEKERRRRREELRRKAEEARLKEESRLAAEKEKRRLEEVRLARERARRMDLERRSEEARLRRESEIKRREEEKRIAEERRRREEERKRRIRMKRQLERERARERERRYGERLRRKRDRSTRRRRRYASFNRGRVLEDQDKFFSAAKSYNRFLRDYASPGTQEFTDAHYYTARSLYNLGLYNATLNYLIPILKKGPRDANYKRAFKMFVVVVRKLSFSEPSIFNRLARHDVSRFSKKFQDAFNYILAKFFYHWGNYRRARRIMAKVSPTSEYYSSAMYITGLLHLQERKEKKTKSLKEAHDSFVKSVLAAEKSNKDARILDLGYLALARLAYEVGQLDGALFYYRKIPKSSPRVGRAYFEKAWTYFLNRKYGHAIGTFHVLHSPYFKTQFLPELYILESTVYLNLCQYKMAKDLAELFQKRYSPIKDKISKLVDMNLPMYKYYKMFVNAGKGLYSEMPQAIYNHILADTEFFFIFSTLRELEKEDRILNKIMRIHGRSRLGNRIYRRLKRRLHRFERRAGKMIRRKLQVAATDLDIMIVKSDEITFDAINAEKEILDKAATTLLRGTKEARRRAMLAKKKKNPTNWSKMYWKFQGEYWEDELDYFRGLHVDRCK